SFAGNLARMVLRLNTPSTARPIPPRRGCQRRTAGAWPVRERVLVRHAVFHAAVPFRQAVAAGIAVGVFGESAVARQLGQCQLDGPFAVEITALGQMSKNLTLRQAVTRLTKDLQTMFLARRQIARGSGGGAAIARNLHQRESNALARVQRRLHKV